MPVPTTTLPYLPFFLLPSFSVVCVECCECRGCRLRVCARNAEHRSVSPCRSGTFLRGVDRQEIFQVATSNYQKHLPGLFQAFVVLTPRNIADWWPEVCFAPVCLFSPGSSDPFISFLFISPNTSMIPGLRTTHLWPSGGHPNDHGSGCGLPRGVREGGSFPNQRQTASPPLRWSVRPEFAHPLPPISPQSSLVLRKWGHTVGGLSQAGGAIATHPTWTRDAGPRFTSFNETTTQHSLKSRPYRSGEFRARAESF